MAEPLTLLQARAVARVECRDGERLAVVHRDGDMWVARYARAVVTGADGPPENRGVKYVIGRDATLGPVRRP